jgi:dTDP-4-amino-4,6-dideoxygalactose transaminase
MNNNKIFVTKSSLPDIDTYIHHVKDIFDSRRLTNYGTKEKLLTEQLKEYFQVENLLLVNNATIGALIIYKAL